MDKIEVLKKLINEMLKQAREENYTQPYGHNEFKEGKIEAIEDILKLFP